MPPNSLPFAARSKEGGFTLIELMITIGLFALLMLLAIPSFTQWVRNTQIRSVAENLQHGLRIARDRASQLNRQVVFSTTNANPNTNVAAVSGGINWGIQSIALNAGDTSHPQFIKGGTFASGLNGITVAGPTALCFNSLQRLVANAATGVGAACAVAPPVIYMVSRTGAVAGKDRDLAVTVSISGEIRMCDPARSLLAGQPDGC